MASPGSRNIPAHRERGDGPAGGRRILLVGAGTIAELAVIRALRAGGFEPWLATWQPSSAAAASAAIAGVVDLPAPTSDLDALNGALIDAARSVRPAVVLPGTEAALLSLAEIASELPELAVGAPSPEITRRVTDKVAVNGAALAAGLAVPDTEILAEGQPHPPLELPAVLKPQRSEQSEEDGSLRHLVPRLVRDRGELRAAIAGLGGRALVQPYIEAPLRTVNGVAWEGELVATVHKLGERTWPTDCGVLSVARTVPVDPDLESGVRRLLGEFAWSGVFNVQFLDADPELLFIDLNPRPYHTIGLTVAAGTDLPSIWVELLLGRPPKVRPYEVGVRWVHARHDLLAIIDGLRSGRGVRPRARRPGRTVRAVASLRDPLPLRALAKLTTKHAIARGIHGIARRDAR